MSAKTYRVEFARIGRNRNAPPIVATADSPNHLAEQVYRHARSFLMSRDVDVIVDAQTGTGEILCGFNSGGTFTFAEVGEGGAA